MAIPEIFGAVQDKAIASYDQVDIAAGVGYTTYYGGIIETSGATQFILSPNQFYSSIFMSGQTFTAQAAPTKAIDFEFNLSPYVLPQNLKGAAIINLPVVKWTPDAGQYTIFPVVKIIKVADGNTETLVTLSGGNWTKTFGTNNLSAALFALNPDIPLTHFKPGDNLRLKAEVWCFTDMARGNNELWIAADPNGRITSPILSGALLRTLQAGDVTTLAIQVPSKIDL